jgi:O-antigen ligase
MLAAFAFGLRAGIASIVLLRPLTDRLLELSPINIAGHDVTYGVVLNIVLISAAITNMFRIRRCVPSGLRSLWLPFLVVCTVAVLYSPVQIDSIRRLSIYVSYYFIFLLSFVVVRSERDVLFLLKLVVFGSVLPVLYGLFETLSGIDWFFDDDSRIQSTFSHPNMFAFYLLAVCGVILFLTATERIRITGGLRLLLTLYLIPVLIVLIMTKTRSAWIGCFVLFFAYGLACDRRVLVAVLVAVPVAFAIPAVSERIMNLMSDNDYIGGPGLVLNSYAWRKLMWEGAFVYIWQQPIFGYGLHSFGFYSVEFFPGDFPGRWGPGAHNDYIQILFETGLVGLIAFLWIFWRCFTWLVTRWRFDRRGVLAAATIMMAYLICSYSDNLLEYLPYQWEFWFPFGVICWHIEQCRAHAGGLHAKGSLTTWSRFTRMRGLPAAGVVSGSLNTTQQNNLCQNQHAYEAGAAC